MEGSTSHEIQKVTFQIDRSIAVPPGALVHTGYVAMDCIRVACRAPMAVGDVERKYELAKQNAPNALFPAPMGHWDGSTFVLVDGRHTKIAYEMLGFSHLFVMWVGAQR